LKPDGVNILNLDYLIQQDLKFERSKNCIQYQATTWDSKIRVCGRGRNVEVKSYYFTIEK